MPPMASKFSLAFTAALLLAMLPAPLSPYAGAAREGVHPYDRANRRPSQLTHVLMWRRGSRLLYDNPYYRRTETHALHPYYRNSYSSFLDTGRARRTGLQRRLFLSGFPYYRVPSATDCRNHSYYRPNYRTPPSDFRCIRH